MKTLVLVSWEDASDDPDTWIDIATALPPKVVVHEQVGWLIDLTPAHVVLCSIYGTDLVSTRTRIPAGMVRSIVELVAGEPVTLPKRKRK